MRGLVTARKHTMKIIKPGKATHYVYVGECRACGCVFEALQRECEKIGYDHRDRVEEYGCKCPTCYKMVSWLKRELRDGPEPKPLPPQGGSGTAHWGCREYEGAIPNDPSPHN